MKRAVVSLVALTFTMVFSSEIFAGTLANSNIVHVTGGYNKTVYTQRYEQTGTHSVWVQTGTRQQFVQTGQTYVITPCWINGVYVQQCSGYWKPTGYYETVATGYYRSEPTYGYVTIQSQQWVPAIVN